MSVNEMEIKVAKLKELEAFEEEIKNEAEALRDEIKAEMNARGTEEMVCGKFIVRFTSVLSSRFDVKRFKLALGEDVYKSFCKEVESRRFSIA